jgi:hypothetical protein
MKSCDFGRTHKVNCRLDWDKFGKGGITVTYLKNTIQINMVEIEG